jgi:hypothetical protein
VQLRPNRPELTTNQKVGSSNLSGRTSFSTYITTTCGSCSSSKFRGQQGTTSRLKPIPTRSVCDLRKATSSQSFAYQSVTVLSPCPIQKRNRSSGVPCFRRCVTLKRRKEWRRIKETINSLEANHPEQALGRHKDANSLSGFR